MRQRALVAGGLVLLITIGFFQRVGIRNAWENFRKPNLPPATFVDPKSGETFPLAEPSGDPILNSVTPTSAPERQLPPELNLAVPFTTQAPHTNWDADHEEFCEEAAVLMAGRYFAKRTIANEDDAEAALQGLKARELELFGYFKDTTAAETAQLLEDKYSVQTRLLRDPTVVQLKGALADGQLILVPSAGRQLGNPNFKRPGPLYHMLVLKGYTTRDEFITNDAGTRKGADYVYPVDRVMTAMHDWNGGEVDSGAKVVILVQGRE